MGINTACVSLWTNGYNTCEFKPLTHLLVLKLVQLQLSLLEIVLLKKISESSDEEGGETQWRVNEGNDKEK